MLISKRAFLVNTVAAFAATVFGRTAKASSQSGVNHSVKIRRFQYDPETIEVRPGDTITWTNQDVAPHTSTALDRSWDTGRIRRNEDGSVHVVAGMPTDYFCIYHPQMRGSIKIV